MALRRAGRASEHAHAPCPVCFEENVTERSHFPCGHSVCTACNATLLQRGFLACPTCRTPREGITQAAVDHANEQRTLQDQGEENGGAGTGTAPAIGMTVSHAGDRYRILFFPDASEGNPFATLGRQDMSGWPAPGGPGGRGARPMRLMRAARTLHIAPPYHTRHARAGRRGERNGEGADGGGSEGEEQEDEEENRENRPPGVRMRLDGPMANLVNGLLNPVDLPEFLARRQRV